MAFLKGGYKIMAIFVASASVLLLFKGATFSGLARK